MDVLFALTTCAFFIWTIRNVLHIVAVLYENEYRFDRLFLYLRETAQGRNILLSLLSLTKWLGIFFYIFVIFQEVYLEYFHVFVFFIYTFQAILVIRDLFLRHGKLPGFTIFTRVIIFFTFVSVVLFYSIPLFDAYFWILIIDRMIPIIITLFVFLFSFPKEVSEDIVIQKAIKKIKKCKDLMVIGITGSYGKSSTKEILFQLLQKDFRVIRSSGENNSLFEISQTILHQLTNKTQILIVEMDAYGADELRKISHIVRPNIGIVTGINDQYLALIGDKEKSANIKFELIESLPRQGLALFNGGDLATYGLFKKTKKDKVVYWGNAQNVKKDGRGGQVVYAENANVTERILEFDAVLPKTRLRIQTSLLGEHIIENILPAIYIAHYFGMSDKDIQSSVKKIIPLSRSMELRKNSAGIFIVDDTLNSTPISVRAAVDYLRTFKKKKIVVLEPMLNIGRGAEKEHQDIGKKIATHCDALLLTNKNYYQEIQKGVAMAKSSCQLKALHPNAIKKYIQSNAKRGDVILFEGEEAENIAKRFR